MGKGVGRKISRGGGGEATKKKKEKEQKIALLSLFQGGRGSGNNKKD